ncbi:MAG: hypothetical protein QHH19_04470, partial [Candidatus Thermoplasmatota archaeon]|nr:hypothetical protein [Candidatus Thermoplasmatota archaeon]
MERKQSHVLIVSQRKSGVAVIPQKVQRNINAKNAKNTSMISQEQSFDYRKFPLEEMFYILKEMEVKSTNHIAHE